MFDHNIWKRQLSPLPTCGAGCAADLPEVTSNNCEPLVLEGEIRRIFIGKRTSTPFTDWADAGEWQSRLSDDDTTSDDVIRTLWVIGDKPAPGQTIKDISNRRRLVVTKSHVLNFTIDDVQPEIHEFVRQLECGGEYKVWYETHGGLLFGGNVGIVANVLPNMILPRGKDEIMTYSGTIEWSAKFTEERIESPIFYYGSAETAIYDTVLSFAADPTPAAANGITAVAPATDDEEKFGYIAIAAPIGTDLVMILQEAGVEKLEVTFKSDYIGTAFKYVTTAGVAKYGNFTNGTINYV